MEVPHNPYIPYGIHKRADTSSRNLQSLPTNSCLLLLTFGLQTLIIRGLGGFVLKNNRNGSNWLAMYSCYARGTNRSHYYNIIQIWGRINGYMGVCSEAFFPIWHQKLSLPLADHESMTSSRLSNPCTTMIWILIRKAEGSFHLKYTADDFKRFDICLRKQKVMVRFSFL